MTKSSYCILLHEGFRKLIEGNWWFLQLWFHWSKIPKKLNFFKIFILQVDAPATRNLKLVIVWIDDVGVDFMDLLTKYKSTPYRIPKSLLTHTTDEIIEMLPVTVTLNIIGKSVTACIIENETAESE